MIHFHKPLLSSVIALSLLTAGAANAGPVLQGIRLNGPLLQGVAMNGPILQGVNLNGPGIVLQGPVLNGPGLVLQGRLFNGPGLVLQGDRFTGLAFASTGNVWLNSSSVATSIDALSCQGPAALGHSPLSGLAQTRVSVKLPAN